MTSENIERRDTLLVVTGAGASFDCIPDLVSDDLTLHVSGLPPRPFGHVRPPLTKDLISHNPFANEVLSNWKWASPVVDYLRRGMGSGDIENQTVTLEQALAKYHELRIDEMPMHLQAFEFFLRDLLWQSTEYMSSADLAGGKTNYTTLLLALRIWASEGDRCVVIVNFNYDLLLEHAAEQVWDFNPWSLDSYLGDDVVSILKPHGSVQWARPATSKGHVTARSGVEFGELAIREFLEGGIDVDKLTVVNHVTHNWVETGAMQLSTPALALPVQSKQRFVWPAEHLARLRQLHGAVSKTLIIGWQALDPMILDEFGPLLRQNGHGMVVTGGEDSEKVANDIASRILGHTEVRTGYWDGSTEGTTDFIRENLHHFLEIET